MRSGNPVIETIKIRRSETESELMAIIALGYPDGRTSPSDRDPVEEKVFLKREE